MTAIRGGSGTILDPGATPAGVPVFQLLQWRSLLRLQLRTGVPYCRRSIRAHACKKLGLRPRTPAQQVIDHITRIVDEYKERLVAPVLLAVLVLGAPACGSSVTAPDPLPPLAVPVVVPGQVVRPYIAPPPCPGPDCHTVDLPPGVWP